MESLNRRPRRFGSVRATCGGTALSESSRAGSIGTSSSSPGTAGGASAVRLTVRSESRRVRAASFSAGSVPRSDS